MLSDIDSGLGIGALAWSWRDVDGEPPEAHGVVVEHGGLVAEGEDFVQVAPSAGAEYGFWGPRGLAEAPVVASDPSLFEVSIGRFDRGDSIESHLGEQAILQHAKEAFDAAFGLRGEGKDRVDAEILEGLPDLGGALASGELFLEAPGVVIAS